MVVALTGDQARRGWKPVVACPSEGELREKLGAQDVRTYTWNAQRSPGASVLRELRELDRIVRQVRPDVVHLHGSKAGLVGRLLLRGKTPTIFQPHLWSFDSDRGPTAKPAKVWERWAARWTSKFVCVSQDERDSGVDAGISGEMVVIRNGIDLSRIHVRDAGEAREELGLEPSAPTVVCVGRLAPLKGQDFLLEAWPEILASVPAACLVFVGDGPTRGALLEDYEIASHKSITWVGWSTRTADYLAAADVVAVPSRAEGMALVPLEAMASGRSVVAFNGGGIRESVDDAGIVLEIGDVAGLARELSKRLGDPNLASVEGRTGRKRVEELFDDRLTGSAVAELTCSLARR